MASAAGNHGIHWGILPCNPAYARRCVALDCRVLSLGIDVWAVQRGLKAFQSEFQEFFGDLA